MMTIMSHLRLSFQRVQDRKLFQKLIHTFVILLTVKLKTSLDITPTCLEVVDKGNRFHLESGRLLSDLQRLHNHFLQFASLFSKC